MVALFCIPVASNAHIATASNRQVFTDFFDSLSALISYSTACTASKWFQGVRLDNKLWPLVHCLRSFFLFRAIPDLFCLENYKVKNIPEQTAWNTVATSKQKTATVTLISPSFYSRILLEFPMPTLPSRLVSPREITSSYQRPEDTGAMKGTHEKLTCFCDKGWFLTFVCQVLLTTRDTTTFSRHLTQEMTQISFGGGCPAARVKNENLSELTQNATPIYTPAGLVCSLQRTKPELTFMTRFDWTRIFHLQLVLGSAIDDEHMFNAGTACKWLLISKSLFFWRFISIS